MSKAIELLQETISYVHCCNGRPHLGPGQVVLRMPQEKRDILKELKSEDLANIRPDSIWGEIANKKRR